MQQDKQQNKERIKESQEAMHKNLLFSPSTLSTAEPQGPMGGWRQLPPKVEPQHCVTRKIRIKG